MIKPDVEVQQRWDEVKKSLLKKTRDKIEEGNDSVRGIVEEMHP